MSAIPAALASRETANRETASRETARLIPADLGDDPRGLHLVMPGPRVQPEDRLRPGTHDFL